MKRGIFCISIDVDLLWGRKDLNYQPFIWRTEKERAAVKKLLELFNNYKISATWAIVGKILDRIPPGTKDPELWYDRGLVEMIARDRRQELACHSFDHTLFDVCTKEEAEGDIKASVRIFKSINQTPESFIFPRNKIGHLDILKRYGFKSFRGRDLHKRELLYPSAPPVYHPTVKEGLLNIPGSMYFVSARGARRFIPSFLRFIKAKAGIKKAINEKAIFHLWFHPVDFVDDGPKLFKTLEDIIVFAKNKEEQDHLQIKTMKDITREVLS